MKIIIFKILGFLFVGIGVLGIFIPLLPTTIFLIIASYFFMKSSPKLNDKLINNKYLGVYLKNYKDKKGIPFSSKVTSICLLWTSIIISAFLLSDNIYIRIILFFVAIGVTVHISTIKNLNLKTISDQNLTK